MAQPTPPTVTAGANAVAGLRAALGGPLPELLAPTGDWACATAAVENGADAIYFGLEKFNARIRAANFTEADLPKLMEFLHRRGVKGYITLNTLVFENEMPEAEQYLRSMIAAGTDAAIVQDVGICRLIRRLSPDFPIHASTQMTITSPGGVEFARRLGCHLVVLARECSIGDIEKISKPGTRGASSDGAPGQAGRRTAEEPAGEGVLPLEVFVHGALCVAYSGQCLTSEALGGRSANRGECAQACRMPYELLSDGQRVELGDRKYLLSPRDLAGLELLPELIRAGVASLKIEGRLKSPEYVANITRIYRRALDECGARMALPAAKGAGIAAGADAASAGARYEMEMAFSRGLYTGWLAGTNNQDLVHARFGRKRGVYLGRVARVLRDSVILHLEGPLKPGDGVVFDAGKPEDEEEGGRVYEVMMPRQEAQAGRHKGAGNAGKAREPGGLGNEVGAGGEELGMVELKFGHGDINFSRISEGDRLWKTSDPELERRLRRSYSGDTPHFRRPVMMEVQGAAGEPMTLFVRDEAGNVARVDSAFPLAPAEKQPLTAPRLREQLGRLGGTPFTLGELKIDLRGDVLLPVSELNRLRREAIAELERQRMKPKRWTLSNSPERKPAVKAAQSGGMPMEASIPAKPEILVLVRNLDQLEAALDSGAATVYCDFENPKRYREAVAAFRSRQWERASPSPSIFVAPPRIFKPGEEWMIEQVRSCKADGYLARNYDHLRFFANERLVGDYSLNIANRLSADYFRNGFGLERVTASYDLNFQQLEALLTAAPAEWFEVTIHQHMPMFHMEHCVFCAFLSTGTDYTNCGRPCDRHDVKLRDRVGAEHPVKADAGCRNTVFNGLAQTGAEYVRRMAGLGVRCFRLEFLNETPEEVRRIIPRYRQVLSGEVTGAQLWRELKARNQLGVTRGQMGGR